MIAPHVAELVSNVGDDGVAFAFFELGSLRCLELLHREQTIAVGPGTKLGPTFESRMVEVQDGGIALRVGSPGEEDHRDTLRLCRVERLQSRFKWLGAGLENP